MEGSQETEAMQLQTHAANSAGIRAFAEPVRCPHCGDWMVAPVVSEFVEGGEIRHHWECDACGETSTTAIPIAAHWGQLRRNGC
jgi:transposase-like protein